MRLAVLQITEARASRVSCAKIVFFKRKTKWAKDEKMHVLQYPAACPSFLDSEAP
jgi:hypothetical protein